VPHVQVRTRTARSVCHQCRSLRRSKSASRKYRHARLLKYASETVASRRRRGENRTVPDHHRESRTERRLGGLSSRSYLLSLAALKKFPRILWLLQDRQHADGEYGRWISSSLSRYHKFNHIFSTFAEAHTLSRNFGVCVCVEGISDTM
jgi:hypothetical protein